MTTASSLQTFPTNASTWYSGSVPFGTTQQTAGQSGQSKAGTKADQAAQDFESVFISEMIKPMFETVDVDDTFGGGKGEEVFRGLLVQQFGKNIAKQGGIGLADQVRAELLKIQEHAKTSSNNATGV